MHNGRRNPFEMREHLRALGLRDTLADDIVATWPHEGRILAEIEAGGRDAVVRLNRADAVARRESASERFKVAMMAMTQIVSEAAKREREMYLRFVKQVNVMTGSRRD